MRNCNGPRANLVRDARLLHTVVRLRHYGQSSGASWRTANETHLPLAGGATPLPCAGWPHQIWLVPSKPQQGSYAISDRQDSNGGRLCIVLLLAPIGSLF